MQVKAVVTDIEGTTTDINFVHRVLFPYAYQHLPDYVLRYHDSSAELQNIIAAVRAELNQPLADIKVVIKTLRAWIEQDKKITALKQLQGLIWENGYREGSIIGHVYEDAFRALQLWKQQGIRLYVFSSGSVKAQQLLFAFSQFGDMRALFTAYYDTNVGHKQECNAYRNISASIKLPPANILFLSDVAAELNAAKQINMQTTLLKRGQKSIAKPCGHALVTSFDQIKLT